MKFTVTMKHADALFYATNEVRDSLRLEVETEPDPDEVEGAVAEAEAFARKYMRYGEYIDVQFDTEAGTATVLEAE